MFVRNMSSAIKRVGVRAHCMLQECFSDSDRQVNFLVGGVQKGGTSALDWYLRSHPEICMAHQKEIHFFDNEIVQKFPSSIQNLYYHSFFNSCNPETMLGEATPIYLWWPNCMERIKDYNKHIKLIFVLRDPVLRAYSHWNMERQRGLERDSFSGCIRRKYAVEDRSRITSYVSRGFYSNNVKRAKTLFSDNQLLFLKQEELLYEPNFSLKQVTDFLGLSLMPRVEGKQVHSRDYDSPLNHEDEVYLRSLFRSDIEELERELGWDLTDWKEGGVYSRNRGTF